MPTLYSILSSRCRLRLKACSHFGGDLQLYFKSDTFKIELDDLPGLHTDSMYHHVSPSRTVLTLEHESSKDIAIEEEFSVLLAFQRKLADFCMNASLLLLLWINYEIKLIQC